MENNNGFFKYILKIMLVIFSLLVAVSFLPFIFICLVLSYVNEMYPIFICSVFSHVLWSIYDYIQILSVRMEIEGNIDDVKNKENCIVIMNHIGGIDFLVAHKLASKKKMLRHCKYLLKDSLIFVPFIGLGVYFLKFCFLKRNFNEDVIRIKKWAHFIKHNKVPLWLIIYPEGTRYTEKKYKESLEFCKIRGLEPFKKLLYPRYKGFLEINKHLDDYCNHIIDVTIHYVDVDKKGVPSLIRFMLGRPKGYFKVKVQTFEISNIGNPQEFLLKCWNDKSETIQKWVSEIENSKNDY